VGGQKEASANLIEMFDGVSWSPMTQHPVMALESEAANLESWAFTILGN
jgi:hypothetical protein